MKRFKSAAALALLAALAAGCAGSGSGGSSVPATVTPSGSSAVRPKDHSNDTLGGVGNFGLAAAGNLINVLLTDAPPVINGMTPSAINLGIDSVEVVTGTGSSATVTTIASYSTPVVVNVMANPGSPSPVAIGQYYSGAYNALRFTIDVASSNMVANGTTYPISFETATATQSTVGAGSSTYTHGTSTTITMTVAGNFVEPNGNPAASLYADFNAMESLNMNSSGQIVARPTLFAVPFDQAGKADGVVQNAAGNPVAGAVVVATDANGKVDNTTTTDANGNFDLHTLAAGQYQLSVYNAYTTASGQKLTSSGSDGGTSVQGPSVTVQAGQTTTVGTIAD